MIESFQDHTARSFSVIEDQKYIQMRNKYETLKKNKDCEGLIKIINDFILINQKLIT